MIIAPKITPIITASNVDVVEVGIDVYDSELSYSVNDTVQVNDSVNRIYKAFTDVPVGVSPADDVNPTTGVGLYWFDYGSTNYMRAFDELNSSKCINTDTIEYTFTTSDIDTLFFNRLISKTIRIIITNNTTDNVLLDETYDTQTREVYDWLDWTVAPTESQTSFFKLLPYSYDTTMQIIIDNTGSEAEVGHIAFGRSKNYGISLIDPSPTISKRSLTTKTRDADGNIITRKKARYKRMKIYVLIDSSSEDLIEERFESIVDTACIFVGDESDGGHRALLIYGEMKDHDMPIGQSKTKYILEVEGYA